MKLIVKILMSNLLLFLLIVGCYGCKSDQNKLIDAILDNNPELVKLLLEKGAKANVKDNHGYTPLWNAALQQVNNTAQQQTNSVKIAEMLLQHGADPNSGTEPPLITACLSGNFELVKLLVKYGADVNIRALPNGSPLKCAVHSFQMTEFLVNKGSHVNEQDPNGYTILENVWGHGTSQKNQEIIKLLVKNGANINEVSRPWGQQNGVTFLNLVINCKESNDFVDFLRSIGAKTVEELGANDESSRSNNKDKETSKVMYNH